MISWIERVIFFVREEAWENMFMGEEPNGFSLANLACIGEPYIKTAVVFWGAVNVPHL